MPDDTQCLTTPEAHEAGLTGVLSQGMPAAFW